MTQNQIAYLAQIQQDQHNTQVRAETHRSNLVNEAIAQGQLEESKRANLAKEKEQNRYNTLYLGELNRHNIAVETETNRSNLVNESIKRDSNAIARNNLLLDQSKLNEQIRSNQANEYLTAQRNAIQAQNVSNTYELGLGSQDISRQNLLDTMLNSQTSRNLTSKRAELVGAQTRDTLYSSIYKAEESRARTQNLRAQTRQTNELLGINKLKLKVDTFSKMSGLDTLSNAVRVGSKLFKGGM